jgi:hypothetical protein
VLLLNEVLALQNHYFIKRLIASVLVASWRGEQRSHQYKNILDGFEEIDVKLLMLYNGMVIMKDIILSIDSQIVHHMLSKQNQ